MNYKPKKVELGQRWEHEVYGKYRIIDRPFPGLGDGRLLENEDYNNLLIVDDLTLLSYSSKYTYLGLPKPPQIEVGQIWSFMLHEVSCWTVLDLTMTGYAMMGGLDNVEDHFKISITSLMQSPKWSYLNDKQAKAIDYGDYCKKCNTFNEYIEKTGLYICYGCRV